MPWSKIGNFSNVFYSGATLRHFCEYKNSTPVNISKLSMGEHSGGKYKIIVESPTKESYQRLVRQMINAGFPKPDLVSDILQSVNLVTSDSALIATFLSTIKEVAPELAEIEQEVCRQLGVDLSIRAIVPIWHQSGNFTQSFRSPGSLNRQVTYETGIADSIINEFSLFGYQDHNCVLKIDFSSSAALERAKQVLATTRPPIPFEVDNLFDNTIKFHFNFENIENFERVLTILSQQSTHFAEISDAFKQHVNPIISQFTPESQQATSSRRRPAVSFEQQTTLTAQPAASVTEESHWTKKGDFSQLFRPRPGSTLNRNCTYEHSAPVNMKELSLCGYGDGDYMISAFAPTAATYQRLEEQIVRAGFPKPDFISRELKQVTLVTSDPRLMASFLLAVKEVAPEIAEIEQEVCQSLGVDLTARAVVPTWHRLGNFSTRHSTGTHLNRQVTYKTGVAGAITNEFALYGYEDHDCIFKMNLVGDASITLREALIASGLPVQFSIDDEKVTFCFSPTTVANFNRLLSIISQHSPEFAEICDAFKEHVNPVITAPIAVQRPQVTFFQGQTAAAATQTLTEGKNGTKLAEIGFNDDNIPDEYRCSLSLAIMTEPVYARGLPQYQFEKAWILRHLSTSNKHPFTREPLTLEDLVPNVALKAKITTFVDDEIRKHQTQDQKGPSNTSA